MRSISNLQLTSIYAIENKWNVTISFSDYYIVSTVNWESALFSWTIETVPITSIVTSEI